MKKIMAFLKDEDGLETVEYAIILGLIVVGVITTIGLIGTWVSNKFEALEEGLNPT
jgi:pilus assembly protein Flp/PilA